MTRFLLSVTVLAMWLVINAGAFTPADNVSGGSRTYKQYEKGCSGTDGTNAERFINPPQSADSAEECAEACDDQEDPPCESFSFWSAFQACLLYKYDWCTGASVMNGLHHWIPVNSAVDASGYNPEQTLCTAQSAWIIQSVQVPFAECKSRCNARAHCLAFSFKSSLNLCSLRTTTQCTQRSSEVGYVFYKKI